MWITLKKCSNHWCIPTLKLSLLKIWSSKLNTLNFMQAISSLFCEHSDLDRSTTSSMALFQFSFLAGCATANANRAHKMKILMALAVICIRLWRFVGKARVVHPIRGYWMRTIATRRLMPMGWAVRYLYEGLSRRIVQCTSKSRALEHSPTSVRVWIFFSFSMVFDYWGLAVDHAATAWWGRIHCASVRSRDTLHAIGVAARQYANRSYFSIVKRYGIYDINE